MSNAAPQNSHAVGEALRSWLHDHAGHPVHIHTIAPLTGGMDNFVYAVAFSESTQPSGWPSDVVLRIRPSVDGYEHLIGESSLQQRCFELGFPAAQVLATIGPADWAVGHPAQVAAKAPGINVLDAMKQSPLRIASMLRLQGQVHTELHDLDVAEFTDRPARRSIADHRLGDVEREIANGHTTFREPLRQVRSAIARLPVAEGEHAVCHGDFHPLNVLLDCDADPWQMTVIDWTDATIDDRHADLARTVSVLRVAAIAAGSSVERVALRIVGPVLAKLYLRAYRHHRSVDDDRLRVYEAVHLLSGLAQIKGLENPNVASASAGQTFHPSLIRMLQRRFDHALKAIQHLC